MRSRVLIALAFLLSLLAPVSAAASVSLRTVDHHGDKYTVVTLSPGAGADLRMYGSPDGLTFLGARAAAEAEGRRAVVLMNGGMYGPSGGPIGLFIAHGKEQHAINRSNGEGNFHLKPNGVFWLSADGRTHVTATDAFPENRSSISFATQSGPMLLINGSVHPMFHADSPNRLVRNGVGVSPDGKTVHLVISQGGVRFHDLATLFRDVLGCRDALYLDGTVSELWSGGELPAARFGVVIAVTEPATR